MTFSNSINWLRRDPGHTENIGITNSSGTTFTVNQANGSAFSTSNPGYVTLQSLANPGQLIVYRITANQSFTQANISGNSFNISSGVNHASAIPFFLYAVSNAQNGENTIAFMVSTFPNTSVSPVAGKIAKTGSAVANSQGSFFCLTNVTVADYASSPCVCIGSFRMTYVASGTNWTVVTFDRGDGIGQFQENRNFALSPGQYGAASGLYFYANSGTAPTFVNNGNGYQVQQKTNMIFLNTAFNNCSSGGSGSGYLQLALPYNINGSVCGQWFLSYNSGPATFTGVCSLLQGQPVNAPNLFYATSASLASIELSSVGTDSTYSLDIGIYQQIQFS
jgi:hypothetical protein